MVVPLGVAVTIERAGRGVVADDPVLVEVRAEGSGEGTAPGEAVSRAARDHRVAVHATSFQEREARDQPHAMTGVIGNRWVGRPIVGTATGPLGDAWQ